MNIDKFMLKGCPVGHTPEKRYLVSFDNLDILNMLPDIQVVEMVDCQEGPEVRTRKVATLGKEYYFRTKEELEEAISKEDFDKSVENMNHLYRLLPRTRYAFCNGIISSAKLAKVDLASEEGRGMFMMLDVFKAWNGFGILTVKGSEVKNLGDLQLPLLTVVKEITNDKTYSTKSIATIDYTSFLE